MVNIYLYHAEASRNNIRLADPTVTRSTPWVLSLSDSLTIDDLSSIEVTPGGGGGSLTIDDSVALGDTLSFFIAKVLADSFSTADQITKQPRLSEADSFSTADQITKQPHLSEADSLSTADQITKQPHLSEADSLSTADQITKQPHLSEADSFSAADQITKQPHLSEADSLSTADQIAKLIALLKNDASTVSDEVQKIFDISLIEELLFDDTQITRGSLAYNDTLTINEYIFLTRIDQLGGVFTVSFIPAHGLVSRDISIGLADTETLSDSLVYTAHSIGVYQLLNNTIRAILDNNLSVPVLYTNVADSNSTPYIAAEIKVDEAVQIELPKGWYISGRLVLRILASSNIGDRYTLQLVDSVNYLFRHLSVGTLRFSPVRIGSIKRTDSSWLCECVVPFTYHV